MSTRIPTAAAAAAAAAATLALSLAMAAQAAEAMRVVRDPATGELRAPNAAEAAAFEKAEAQLRARSGKAGPVAPVEVRYPDGTVETKLSDDTMMYSVVTSAADGTLTMNCLPAREAQALVLKTSKKTTAAKAASKAGHAHP